MIYFFDIHESKECNSRPPYEYILENYFSYFSTKTYVFGYSKEPSHWDGSYEHQKHMFKLMGKEINAILGAQTILIWTYAIGSV